MQEDHRSLDTAFRGALLYCYTNDLPEIWELRQNANVISHTLLILRISTNLIQNFFLR